MVELEKAISVAERDPAYYGLNEVEIGKRRNWTSTARNQVVLQYDSLQPDFLL